MNNKSKDMGDWEDDKEMNPAADSTGTVNIRDSEQGTTAGAGARKAPESADTGDPGRTPGKAEGVDDPEIEGNE